MMRCLHSSGRTTLKLSGVMIGTIHDKQLFCSNYEPSKQRYEVSCYFHTFLQ